MQHREIACVCVHASIQNAYVCVCVCGVFQVGKGAVFASVGEWGWGVEGKQVGSMDEESQVRGCYNITFICTPTNQETVSVLEKTQANKTFRT